MIKRYLIYFLLLPILAACTDDGAPACLSQEDTAYQVTGSIRSMLSCSPRAIDNEQGTAFEANDEILIGLDGSDKTYTYVYSPDKNIFSPGTTDNDKGLWSELITKGSSNADIYAWFKNTSSTTVLPSLNSTLSVAQDQTTEEGYKSSLYMAAHIRQAGTATTLNFTFAHLVCRLKLSIDFNDKSILYSDIQNTVVKMRLYTSATLGKSDPDGDYKLTVDATNAPTDDIVMLTTWDDKDASHLESVCLLPPQTLTAGHSVITITLNNGKEYTCTLSKDLPLEAGTEAKIPIEIVVGGTSVYDPVVSVVPQTQKTSYSGNRLITGNVDKTITIYEKQADGSWGTPAYVYAGKKSDERLEVGQQYFASIDICGDYAGAGVSSKDGGSSATGDIVYLLQKDKSTGKWYKVSQETTSGYSLAINNNFIIYGSSSGPCNAIPIDKNEGFLIDSKETFQGLNTYKLCIADNDVFCNGQKVYQLQLGSNGKPTETEIANINGTRCFTDGKKAIRQEGDAPYRYPVQIYNLAEGKYEIIDSAINAGSGRSVVIYDKYALVGRETIALVLYYFDGNQWRRLGEHSDDQSFLKILQKYAPSNQIKDLSSLDGSNLMMKGTKVSVVSNNITYFVENIDQIVKQYLADNPLSTTN